VLYAIRDEPAPAADGRTVVTNKILVVTHFPSPYQVEFFDRISQQRPGVLVVAYLHREDKGRSWTNRAMAHDALFLSEPGDWQRCLDINDSAALVVYNYYQDQRSIQLMRRRARSAGPWVFWGERPGFRNGWLGKIARRFALRQLHASHAPIWGIGGWAVDAYRGEFGFGHQYVNLPYFSNLDRYGSVASTSRIEPLVFVYVGSLTHRKGVDLLAGAFIRIANQHSHVRLRVVGSGDLDRTLRDSLASVADRVEFAGFKDWKDAPLAYRGGHVLCVPSRHDGWALVVPEGLSAGLPVISTDRTGAALDLIADGGNGWIVPADDATALFEAMDKAARLTAQDWSTMSEAARATVACHSLTVGAERFLRAADQAIRSVP
jgi:glycosyltransferase involved in cell wall biosynthesis